jgi:hypothetical protein
MKAALPRAHKHLARARLELEIHIFMLDRAPAQLQ